MAAEQQDGKASIHKSRQQGSRDLDDQEMQYDGRTPLIESEDSKRSITFHWQAVILPFIFPALGGTLYGYDIGATSGATLSLESASLSGTDWYDLSSLQAGLVSSGSLFGALFGSILAFTFADYLGRRRQLMVASLLYTIGAIATAAAPSFGVLVAGRLVYGLAIGMAMHGAPLYIAETCPAEIRGSLVSMKEGLIVVGMLLGYLAGALTINTLSGWRYTYGAAIVLSLVLGVGMWWLPSSPRWILLRAMKGSGAGFEATREVAVVCVRRLRGKRVSEEVVQDLVEEIVDSLKTVYAHEENKATFGEIFEGTSLKALVIGVGLVLFQQITGQPSVLYYAASILQSAGFSAASDATKVSVFIGLFKLIMTTFAIWKVDKLGRRPLLITGVTGLVLSLFLLTIYYSFASGAAALAVVSLLLYVGCYQISFGPIVWLMVSEIFPIRTRGRALSIAVSVNFAANAIVTFSFSPLVAAIGTAITFLIFGIIGLFALVFIVVKVPETKGLSLEEIETKLSS